MFVEFHPHTDQIPTAAADNLLVQEIGDAAPLVKILRKIRGFVDEKVEHLATSFAANIQKEPP